MPAQAKYDELTAKIEPVKKQVDEAIAKARMDVKEGLSPLRGEVEDYFDSLLGESDAVWKLKVLSETKDRVLKRMDVVDKEEPNALDIPGEVLNEIKNALGWVVPRPVDPVVVEEVKRRDRAADMAARAERGIGITRR